MCCVGSIYTRLPYSISLLYIFPFIRRRGPCCTFFALLGWGRETHDIVAYLYAPNQLSIYYCVCVCVCVEYTTTHVSWTFFYTSAPAADAQTTFFFFAFCLNDQLTLFFEKGGREEILLFTQVYVLMKRVWSLLFTRIFEHGGIWNFSRCARCLYFTLFSHFYTSRLARADFYTSSFLLFAFSLIILSLFLSCTARLLCERARIVHHLLYTPQTTRYVYSICSWCAFLHLLLYIYTSRIFFF